MSAATNPGEGQAVPATHSTARNRRRQRGWPILQNRQAVVGLCIIGFFVGIAILGFWPVPYSLNAVFHPLDAPSLRHLLGTTDQGQDLLSEFTAGTQTSLLIGVVAGGLSTAVGLLVGLIPTYIGGWVDEVFQGVVNIFLVIPGLPLMVVLAAYLSFGGELPIIMVVALTGWAFSARVLRAQFLSLRNSPYVDAARMAGQSGWRIVIEEVIPNMYSLIFSSLLFAVVYAILAATSLTFLGFGNLNIQSWGTILYWAQNDGALSTGAWWWFVPPGLAIAVFGAGLTLVNYGIDAITNPRLRVYGSERSRRSPKQRSEPGQHNAGRNVASEGGTNS